MNVFSFYYHQAKLDSRAIEEERVLAFAEEAQGDCSPAKSASLETRSEVSMEMI